MFKQIKLLAVQRMVTVVFFFLSLSIYLNPPLSLAVSLIHSLIDRLSPPSLTLHRRSPYICWYMREAYCSHHFYSLPSGPSAMTWIRYRHVCRTYLRLLTPTHAHTYAHTYAHTHAHTYTHTHAHTHTYLHLRTPT